MDYDNDGIADLVSGSYQPGSIYVFRGLGKGRFADRVEVVDRDGKAINPSSAPDAFPNTRNFRRKNATEPCITDWDDDGDLDLLIGSMEGEVVLVVNEGTRERPAYAKAAKLVEHAGRPIRVPGGEAGPTVADWDGDGALDLLCGCGDGGVFFFRNVGKRGAPRYAEGKLIIPHGAKRPQVIRAGGTPVPGHTTRIDVVDYDGDGALDILLGDDTRVVHVKDGLGPEAEARVTKLLAARAKVESEICRLMRTREDEMWRLGHRPKGIFPRTNKPILALWDKSEHFDTQLAKCTKTTHHGFVWVFLRKAASAPVRQ